MKRLIKNSRIGKVFFALMLICSFAACKKQEKREIAEGRIVQNFNKDWNFQLGKHSEAKDDSIDLTGWRTLDVPHDWSIEGEFSEEHPTKPEGGALPAGIGWYRKSFEVPADWKERDIFISFDGVYRNSEVWINGEYLGKRPFGYISFQYELTPYLKFEASNVIAVKVDNSAQPNSRWYTGSGIYRNVHLIAKSKIHIDHWGTFTTTPFVSEDSAKINLKVKLKNRRDTLKNIQIKSVILDHAGQKIADKERNVEISAEDSLEVTQEFNISNPKLWDTENPYLYSINTSILQNGKLLDNYKTPLGIREFYFDAEKGFFLNGELTKIHGVCLHHDNGALGAAINIHALERKLKLLKDMGANAIRMAHNPPSPEMLELTDKMGFIVQDEAFDVWKKGKVKEDYQTTWDDWYEKDLKAMLYRDRNHPSIMMWSIGNEIREQFDSTGLSITKELIDIVKSIDTTRPVTSALTENIPEKNFIWQSGALDLLGFNYKHEAYEDLPNRFPNQKFISSESISGLMSRGSYDMPSNERRNWPPAHNEEFDGNEDYTVSAYDQVSAYWGSTHEETWKTVKKLDHMAGMFVWTGFDYLGEPIPYPYPARSSYFGIIDLAGFPKDVYYMYKSEWNKEDVLHIFPHWNWEKEKTIDVWAYYNNADQVELFLNGKSLGTKSKKADDLHISWRVEYEPGTLKAISRKNGKTVLEKIIKSAGDPFKIKLEPNKSEFIADGDDLIFVTVDIVDKDGVLAPRAENLVNFEVIGGGKIVGVDNGYQASLESFKANKRKAFNGKCLVIIQSNGKNEPIKLQANSEGLESESVSIQINKKAKS
ncbi:beta-galactosidase GalB [Zunongwangia endophytica]|uniref:Beta-galactosidase GalB n=1 Tax=Zunongwangia endophytica TaxID=1808945 RepID=A0ABV8H9T9_9FLAO|nr:beta-galactosidase GalB [Zunongwangia endophytica]MDN3594816.1 beta-galactosidase GalB [Zunongwangia endophytica]